ncbi:MAG: hypothetical protein JJE30_00045 [Desulfuromonadales bacterium]|nr:hypothetical protein [Desulfuromonadales bacterium]
MRKKIIIALLILSAVTVTFGLNQANAGLPGPPGLPAPPNVNVHVNGYLPAPPGVNVMIDSGRPYYVERDRRVYIERERPAKHYKKYKKYKKHHEDNGRGHGHDKH